MRKTFTPKPFTGNQHQQEKKQIRFSNTSDLSSNQSGEMNEKKSFRMNFEPRQHVINNILNFSRAYCVIPLKSTVSAEVIIN